MTFDNPSKSKRPFAAPVQKKSPWEKGLLFSTKCHVIMEDFDSH